MQSDDMQPPRSERWGAAAGDGSPCSWRWCCSGPLRQSPRTSCSGGQARRPRRRRESAKSL